VVSGDGRVLGGLLDREPAVVSAGIGLLADALAEQAARVTRVDWRPPPPGLVPALRRLAADPRREAANAEAVSALVGASPQLVDVKPASEAVHLAPGEFLHAGPPIDWASASGPLRGALIGAILYEGLAGTAEEAALLAERGGISLEPCHHRGAVGPMAGVVSPSMPMFVLADASRDGTAFCTLNEGLGKVLRYGAYGPEVIDRLRWMQQVLAPSLRAAAAAHGPVDVRALIAQALQMGDDGHNRNRAGTSLFLREVLPDLLESGIPNSDLAAVTRFISGNDHFFLNLVMPAGKLAADAARGIPGSTMVVAMARNGTEFGIQTAGTGNRWFTAPATVPHGLYLGDFGPDDANPDIGDSTITETSGIGGFAMAAAPAIVSFIGGQARDALAATRSMYEITLAEHPAYQIPILDFRGSPTGIDVTRVVRTGLLPVVNTGIAGRVAGTGQVGAGLVEPPFEVFAAATRALADVVSVPGPGIRQS
jgi:Protein of unknown function (DUF1116)